jgi:putative ABC transport system substrate-binding protein
LYAVKRLALGVLLIAAASATLLIADREHRASAPTQKVKRIAILQHANTAVLDEGIRGTIDGLASRGFNDGGTLKIERFNAQGDMPTGIAIARQVTAGGYDLVITSSTPSMQAWRTTTARARSNICSRWWPIRSRRASGSIARIRCSIRPHGGAGQFPARRHGCSRWPKDAARPQRIGTAWNPSETNSLIFVERGRKVRRGHGLTLLEANADNTSAVGDAINSLIARDAQASGWRRQHGDCGHRFADRDGQAIRLPVFTILPGKPDRGTLFDAGPDFYQVGRQGGLLAADILEGAGHREDSGPRRARSRAGVSSRQHDRAEGAERTVDDAADCLASASVVVDETGVHKKLAPVDTAKPSTDRRPVVEDVAHQA